MKKVLHIGGNLRINGISTFILNMYKTLNKDYQFIIVNTAYSNGELEEEFLALGAKIYHVQVKGKGFIRALKQALAIKKIIHKENIDVLHSHYTSNNGLYLLMAFLENVPIRIAHSHNPPYKTSFAKSIAFYASKILCNIIANYRFACSSNVNEAIYNNKGITFNMPIDEEKFKIKNDKIEIYKRYELNPNKKYLLFVGRISEQKNPFFLLDILEKLDDIHLLIVGEGILLDELKEKSIEYKLENRIHFFKARTNCADLMNIAELLLLSSLYEGLALVRLEAQAIGLPVFASNNVKKEESIKNTFYFPLDASLWASEILKILEMSLVFTPYIPELCLRNNAAFLLSKFYDNTSSEEWLKLGKIFNIGSKEHYFSKEKSKFCFKVAHKMHNLKASFYYALSLFEEKQKQKSHEIMDKIFNKIMQRKEESDFCVILGDIYSFGIYLEQDFEKAFVYYIKAAKLGNLEAMCDLGYMYLVGQGVEKDEKLSYFWWKKSADLGYLHSIRDVGLSYLEGLGVEKNIEQAKHYFALASENNYVHGTTDLALLYLDKDKEKAKTLFKLAILQDKERAYRDIIANQLSIRELIENDVLVFNRNNYINTIDMDNCFDGILFINKFINTIDPACFYEHDTIIKIFVEKDNPHFSMQNGVLFNKDKTKLIHYPIGLKSITYVVPDSVISIGDNAFQNARFLKDIKLSSSIIELGNSAFDDCKSLKSIELGNSIRYIGDWCFHACDSLEKINLPSKLIFLGHYALGSCEKLSCIEIKDNPLLTCIDGNLYNKDISIILQYAIGKKEEKFILPKSVKDIAFRAFSDAYYIKEIIAPQVEIINEKAFYYATSLEKITLNKEVQLFGEHIFDKASAQLKINYMEKV